MESPRIIEALGAASSLVWGARIEAYDQKLRPVHDKLCRVIGHLDDQMQEELRRATGDDECALGTEVLEEEYRGADYGDDSEPEGCEECARERGPHYTGPCGHGEELGK